MIFKKRTVALLIFLCSLVAVVTADGKGELAQTLGNIMSKVKEEVEYVSAQAEKMTIAIDNGEDDYQVIDGAYQAVIRITQSMQEAEYTAAELLNWESHVSLSPTPDKA